MFNLFHRVLPLHVSVCQLAGYELFAFRVAQCPLLYGTFVGYPKDPDPEP